MNISRKHGPRDACEAWWAIGKPCHFCGQEDTSGHPYDPEYSKKYQNPMPPCRIQDVTESAKRAIMSKIGKN